MRAPLLLAMALLLVFGSASPAAAGGAWLGLNVTYQDDPARRAGSMTVVNIYPESPAARAGLRVGDVITHVNGVAFRFPDWTATVAQGGPFSWVSPGERVRCTLVRGGKTEEIEVVAAALPPEAAEERRQHQEKLIERRGPEVFDALARKGTLLRVERKAASGPLVVAADGLASDDAAALAFFLDGSRLRLLFTRLQAGETMKLRLGLQPGSQEPKIEVIP